MLTFDLIKDNSKKGDGRDRSRLGRIITDHGVVETPIFMPVGTVGSVKAVSKEIWHIAGPRLFLAIPTIYICGRASKSLKP